MNDHRLAEEVAALRRQVDQLEAALRAQQV